MPHPAIEDIHTEQRIAILMAAYNKHAGALGSIESSQQTLLNIVLGIFSAALTLLIGLYKDSPALLRGEGFLGITALDWVMILAAALVMLYTHYMSIGRNAARLAVRTAVENIDAAFGFFEAGLYLKDKPLYPDSFAPYARTSFLQKAHWLVYLPGAAFIFAVLILSQS